MMRSTSSTVLQRPKVNSSEPCASSCSRPHEMSVCDGSSVLELHAEPVEAAMPALRSQPGRPANFHRLRCP